MFLIKNQLKFKLVITDKLLEIRSNHSKIDYCETAEMWQPSSTKNSNHEVNPNLLNSVSNNGDITE